MNSKMIKRSGIIETAILILAVIALVLQGVLVPAVNAAPLSAPGPTVAITSAEAEPATSYPFSITVTFSADVTGFTLDDLVLGNAVAANFAGSGSVYTADIYALADGALTVDIPEGAAEDVGANATNAAPQFSRTFDGGRPSLIISTVASDPASSAPIPVTFTFSEDVTGFILADISVGNGSADNFSTVSALEYTADVTPTVDGGVTVDVAADVSLDSATGTKGNLAAPQFSFVYDTTSPDATISSSESSPTNTNPIPISITFTEEVSSFNLADINVGNGSASNFGIVNAAEYTADITPTADGAVTVDIAAAVAEDAAGNLSNEATQFNITFDSTAPITSLLLLGGGTDTNSSPFVVSVSFSEAVTDFDISDLIITNGSASNFTGSGDTYEFDVTPTAEGTVGIQVPAASGIDAAGNGNLEGSLDIDYDATSPTVVISTSEGNPTANSPIPFTVDFSEGVTGFELSDVLVGNGTAGNFVTVTDSQYTFDITPTSEGEVTVDIDPDIASDPAGNFNLAASQYAITYAVGDLTVAITSSESDPTNNSPFEITITFSEGVTGFAIGDLTVGNGTSANFSSVSASVYTADITPVTDGEVTVDIAAGAALDSATGTLSNLAASQFSLVYDGTAPGVVVSSVQSTPTNDSPIDITIEFDEDVIGLAAADFTLTNATPGTLSGSGQSYTLPVTPSISSGFVTVTLKDEECEDGAGNRCGASIPYTIEYDSIRPGITISNPADGELTFTFTEDVTGFVLSDISVSGATLSNFTGSGHEYSADYNPTSSSASVSVAAGVASDDAGNTNTASNILALSTDSSAPSLLSINRLDANPTKASSVRFAVTFSEPVDSLDLGDLAIVQSGLSGVSIISISGSGSIFTVTVSTGTGSGTLELRLSTAHNIEDLSGNPLSTVTVASQVYTIDRIPVTLTAATLQMNLIAPTAVLTVQFSEPVNDPVGNSDTDDVTNPNNYLLLQTGTDGVYNTTTCLAGVSAQDVRVPVNSVTYNNSTYSAALSVNNGVLLSPGSYRLIICGTTSITDQTYNPLNGGSDSQIDIIVWDRQTYPQPLPQTGFEPIHAASISNQIAHTPTGRILSIPSIGLRTEMVHVPFKNNNWDITWLGDKVGVLFGQADLSTVGNTVITGHNWDYGNIPGPFLKLEDLKPGDLISIESEEGNFSFTVTENLVVDQYDFDSVFVSVDMPTITLMTCDGYDPYTKIFTQRRVIRAVLN